MKKTKIMLAAILVAAITGGLLAFKVKKVGTTDYCFSVTDTEPPIGACTFTANNKTARIKFTGDPVVYYTTTDNVNNCSQAHCHTVGIPDQE